MTPTVLRPTPLRSGLRLLIALAATLPFSISAQVNMEALRQDDPPLGYSGTFGGDLTMRTGNVDLRENAPCRYGRSDTRHAAP